MKLAIIGSRDFTDQEKAEAAFKRHCCTYDENPLHGGIDGGHVSYYNEIISGGARGADLIGAAIAKRWRLKLTEYIPDWETHGKKAGFLRNQDIVANADMVLAFWDGISKGTGHSLSIAKRLKKPTLIIYV